MCDAVGEQQPGVSLWEAVPAVAKVWGPFFQRLQEHTERVKRRLNVTGSALLENHSDKHHIQASVYFQRKSEEHMEKGTEQNSTVYFTPFNLY